MSWLEFLLSIIGIITLVFLLADAWLELGVWLSRIHFGRWSDRGEWQRALERKARDYLKHSPTVRKTEQTRLVLIDMLQGNFRSKAIQSWQDAGLILGLDEKDAVGYAGHHPNLFKRKVILPEDALLAYALFRKNALNASGKELIDNHFQAYSLCGKTVPYRGASSDLRYVDTLGMICPYLCATGQATLAEKQLKEYDEALLDGVFPPHVWNTRSKLPYGVYDWSRGIGWYILALVESPELPGRDARMKKLADALLPLRRKDGGFSLMMFNSSERFESSGTALAGLLFLRTFETTRGEKYLQAAKAVEKSLMQVTRRNGAIDYAQGDTRGIGFYSNRLDIMPFAQGMTLYLSKKLNEYV